MAGEQNPLDISVTISAENVINAARCIMSVCRPRRDALTAARGGAAFGLSSATDVRPWVARKRPRSYHRHRRRRCRKDAGCRAGPRPAT